MVSRAGKTLENAVLDGIIFEDFRGFVIPLFFFYFLYSFINSHCIQTTMTCKCDEKGETKICFKSGTQGGNVIRGREEESLRFFET